jgi:hypothetical protein
MRKLECRKLGESQMSKRPFRKKTSLQKGIKLRMILRAGAVLFATNFHYISAS